MLPINKAAKNVYTILPSDYTVRNFVDQCYNVYEVLLGSEVQPFIIKTYYTKQHAEAEVANLLKLFEVEGVSKLLDYCTDGDKFWWTILMRIPGMDVVEYCKKFGLFREGTLKPIIKTLCNILIQLQSIKIIYTDLKPENIMYNPLTKNIYLIDFESNDKKTSSYHTPEYIKSGMDNSSICDKTTSWELGVTVYYLLSGKFPFRDRKQICESEPIMNIMWSENLCEFLGCLLDKDRKNRYSIDEALSHPWLSV